ncbi:permease [Flexithrix dorotheae]|uniref:permease n=1 Tax=Flexithrix dorotheae TaxID=70993 RepID=UPI0003751C01|nr:permease [Flexithrix dorotheae]
MEYIYIFIEELIDITNEMSPYLLLGFLFAGLLHVYFPKDKINKYLGKRKWTSVVNAAILGVPLPLCSCGVIPTGISFYKNGASKGSTVSFLISTPQTGVDSILATYSLMGLPFAIIRPFIALFTGILGGFFTNKFDGATLENEAVINGNHQKLIESKDHSFKRMFNYAFVEFLQDITKWLVIGLLIATLISVVIPEDFFIDYLGNEYLGMLLLLAASIPMYVCATGSIPIATVLLMKGLSPGAALVFLMAGPATNAATITVIGKTMGRKSLVIYLFTIVVSAIGFGIFINEFLPKEWFLIMDHGMMQDHNSQSLSWQLFQSLCSIALVLLMINGYLKGHNYFQQKKATVSPSEIKTMENVTIKVKGMTCNHCKMNVEKNLSQLEGIENSEVDLSSSSVAISGNNLDINKIKTKVEEIGYEYVGEAN